MRADAVSLALGLSEAQIYNLVKRGDFPLPRQVSTRVTGWLRDEVAAWAGELPPSTHYSAKLKADEEAAKALPVTNRLKHLAQPDDVLASKPDPKEWAEAGERGDAIAAEVGFKSRTEDAA